MTLSKVFKVKIEVKAKTVIMDNESLNEDGDPTKILFNKTKINETIIKRFTEAMTHAIEEIDQDDELRDAIFEDLMIDTADYDLGDIAEVRISF